MIGVQFEAITFGQSIGETFQVTMYPHSFWIAVTGTLANSDVLNEMPHAASSLEQYRLDSPYERHFKLQCNPFHSGYR